MFQTYAVHSGCDCHTSDGSGAAPGTAAALVSSFTSCLSATAAEDVEPAVPLASALALCFLSAPLSDAAALLSAVELAVSRSDGVISLARYTAHGGADARASARLDVTASWLAHTYGPSGPPAEVWAIAAQRDASVGSAEPARILWSGADDALLKLWDLRCVARRRARGAAIEVAPEFNVA